MGLTVHQHHHKSHLIRGVDITDAYFVQNIYYRMSYRLGCTEDNIHIKNVVNEAQKYYNM
jgi:hypothetical protein